MNEKLPKIKIAIEDAMNGFTYGAKWFIAPTDISEVDNVLDRDLYYESYIIEEVKNFPFEVNEYDCATEVIDRLNNYDY